jgi:methylglutaconyl-CoA hydratase
VLSTLVPAAQLDATIDSLLGNLLACGREALAKIKDLIRAVASRPIDDSMVADTARRIAEIRGSAEGKEGVASFLEKRKPSWVTEGK